MTSRLLLPLALVALTACGETSGPSTPRSDTSYTVVVRWVGTAPSSTIQAAFTNAASRIQQIVTGDIPDAQIGSGATPCNISDCNASMTGASPLNEVVDDLVIYAKVDSIDGVGNVLGSAGPCLTRTVGGLTGLGIMRFDSADLNSLATNGRLGDVILHEMLHVVGIGTLWESKGILLGKDSATVRVTGALATSACANDLGGASVCSGSVPAENCENLTAGTSCGAGTRNAHWKESTFRTELMTGYAGATNVLSRMTVQGIADLGYTVNVNAADAYTVPPAALRASVTAAEAALAEPVVALPEPERPRFQVDGLGRVTRIRR